MLQRRRATSPVVPPTLEQRVPNVAKGTSRSKSTQRVLPSKSIRFSTSNQHTSSQTRTKKVITKMPTNNNLPALPRPPDPTLFIHAGTSGVRHLFPIHLIESNIKIPLFSRSISRLRSRTPSTDLCTNLEMIRNICSSIQTLEHFDISENDLENLPNDICLLVHLRTLNCSHNQLSNIPELFQQLNQLRELDLSDNQFKHFPSVIYAFPHLIRLNCEHNSIKTIDSEFVNLKQLKTLVLDHNEIETLETIDFSLMKKLEYIHIAHNQLSQFPFNLHKLIHLKNVNLSHNQLTIFPIELLLINTLDVLNLSHNLLMNLSPLSDAYKRTTLIFSIDLSFNQLTKFPDYLLLITLKLDLSNNRIQTISNGILRKLNHETMHNRELRISNNPLIRPSIPVDILNGDGVNTINILPIIRNGFEEQHNDQCARQGFKICITGGERSGKSALAFCLDESIAYVANEKEERFVNILQFPFRFTSRKPHSSSATKPIEASKGKKLSNASPRSSSISRPPLTPLESTKSLPLTVFDFSGSSKYYAHMSPFIDTNALHLVCIHTADFHRTTPDAIEEVFSDTFNRRAYPILSQLFQILQILCEKVTKTNGMVIIPVATCIDLYDQRVEQEKIVALDKINQFFKLYLQFRINRIKHEINHINSLPTISASLSYRLKIYESLLNINIQIQPCQPISSRTYHGIPELNQTIQHCIVTHKTIFPHLDRILPTLWTDANRYIESLADHLSVPYLSYEDFTSHIITKHGLSNLIDDIAMSLSDEGKIVIVNEIGTSNRIVFLRPLWLADLLTALFNNKTPPESNYPFYIKEYHQHGRLHSDLLRSLWINLLHKKELFYPLWLVLMRFLLIAYPKMSRKQLNNLLLVEDTNHIKFDYAIVPFYLPLITSNERAEKKRVFHKDITHSVSVCYKSFELPLAFFHRYSVSAMMTLGITYTEHWNDFILGKYEEDQVKFLMETDHQTYVNCYCGTKLIDQPFEHIWNALMLLLTHFEEMFTLLAPNHQFHRYSRCPFCNEYSFLGEWTTPRELQGVKQKTCSLCGRAVDTNYLVQPNESKRRNEELLRRIRERKATDPQQKASS